MRKPLVELIDVPLTGTFRWRKYGNPPSLSLISDNSATRTAGGTSSEIRRSPGPKEPLREKPYTRSLKSAVRMNGDLAFFSRSGNSTVVSRLTGSFSNMSSSTSVFAVLGTSLGVIPSSVSGFFSRYAVADPPVSVDLKSQCEVKALNKLRGEVDIADLSFGLLWGERKETCELLESMVSGTWRLMRAAAFRDYSASARELSKTFGVTTSAKQERRRLERIERKLRKEAKKIPSLAQRAVAGGENAILAYNLGISPLVNDVKAAMKALAEGDLTSGFDIKVKSTYSRTLNDEITWYADPDPRDRTTQCVAKAAETHGYTVTFAATPRWDTWTLLSRLGIADLSLAWQLTSLTFLVDYHLAVGPWLESLNALREFTWRDGSYTQRYTLNIRVDAKSTLGLGLGKASGYGVVNHTKRRMYSKFPVPMPPMSRRLRNLSSSDAQDAASKRALNQAALSSRAIRDCMNGIFR